MLPVHPKRGLSLGCGWVLLLLLIAFLIGVNFPLVMHLLGHLHVVFS